MCKPNDCTPRVWGKDSVIVNGLYEFSEPVKSASLAVSKDTPANKKVVANDDQVRSFKTARLFQVNEELGKFFFIGHKVPENGAKKSNRKYVFGLPIPQ